VTVGWLKCCLVCYRLNVNGRDPAELLLETQPAAALPVVELLDEPSAAIQVDGGCVAAEVSRRCLLAPTRDIKKPPPISRQRPLAGGWREAD
jgi:hypothetical protein